MGWVRLDDRISEHPKLAAAGPLGLALYVAGLAYCNRNLTDGFIPRSVAATLLDDRWTDENGEECWVMVCSGGGMVGPSWDLDCLEIADHLVHCGLFHRARNGYQVHDYDHFQPSRDEVLASRKKTAERVKRHRERKTETVDNASNAVTNALVQVPQPQPQRESSKELSRKTAKDELWEALVAEIGEPSTKSERGRFNAALKELREVGASPDDVRKRCKAYRREWPEIELTPQALVGNWTRFAGRGAPEKPGIEETLDLPELSDAERAQNLERIQALTQGLTKEPV